MKSGQWQKVCVVGLGGHARSKLVPAIVQNGQSLVGVVTSKSPDDAALPPDTPAFKTVEAAMAALPAETLFVIATPPALHLAQIMPLLSAGLDAIVEKPAFVTADDARFATLTAQASGSILVEGFMNRYTETHRQFLVDWRAFGPTELDFQFTIPNAPSGTFRSGADIGSSNLYDMGCYLLAALTDVGLPLQDLEIADISNTGKPDRELLRFAGNLDGIAVTAKVGVDAAYVNRLQLRRLDASITYAPFTYGRPGPRIIETIQGSEASSRSIDDVNAFREMLGIPRKSWLVGQAARFDQMVGVATHLERLGSDLARARMAA